jgi:hypothetical protein
LFKNFVTQADRFHTPLEKTKENNLLDGIQKQVNIIMRMGGKNQK